MCQLDNAELHFPELSSLYVEGGPQTRFAQDLEAVATLLLGGGVELGDRGGGGSRGPRCCCRSRTLSLWAGPLCWLGVPAGPAAFPPAPGAVFGFPDT